MWVKVLCAYIWKWQNIALAYEAFNTGLFITYTCNWTAGCTESLQFACMQMAFYIWSNTASSFYVDLILSILCPFTFPNYMQVLVYYNFLMCRCFQPYHYFYNQIFTYSNMSSVHYSSHYSNCYRLCKSHKTCTGSEYQVGSNSCTTLLWYSNNDIQWTSLW